jgi:hypothetical protein
MTIDTHVCIDCQQVPIDHPKAPRSVRKVVGPGPRCDTHDREEKKRQKAHSRASRVKKVYGITSQQYERLKAYQRGVCAICRRATGRTKALAVDHDHATGEVRGLLCSPCNIMIGRMRDQPEAFQRALDYLIEPISRPALARAQDENGEWDWQHPIPDRSSTRFIPAPRMPME